MSKRCCALILILLVAGCGKSVPELIAQAKTYEARGEKSAAAIELKNALARPGSGLGRA